MKSGRVVVWSRSLDDTTTRLRDYTTVFPPTALRLPFEGSECQFDVWQPICLRR